MNSLKYFQLQFSNRYSGFGQNLVRKRTSKGSNLVKTYLDGPKWGRNRVNEKSKLHSTTDFKTVNFYNKKSLDEKKTYDFKKRLYSSYSKFTEVKLITIGIASPLRILQWAEKTLPNGKIYGEVLNANTLHHKTFKPQKGGLFCERIFGPLKDFECSCGKMDKTVKYSVRVSDRMDQSSLLGVSAEKNNKTQLEEQNIDTSVSETNLESKKSLSELSVQLNKDKMTEKSTRKLRKFCPDCDVEYTWSVIRRYQLGYIKLISPVTHVWFLKGTPSYLSILLDIKKRNLQSITYCSETFTIEHSDSAATALHSYKTSGFDLNSPSKIYAAWSKAKNLESIISESSEVKDLTLSSEIQTTNQTQKLADKQLNPLGSKLNDTFSVSKQKRLNTIKRWKSNILPNIESQDRLQRQKSDTSELDVCPPDSDFSAPLISDGQSKRISQFYKYYFSTGKTTSLDKPRGFVYQKPTSRIISILQLSLIYNDLVQGFYSKETFNLQSLLIQKILYEEQGLFNIEDGEHDLLSPFLFRQNAMLRRSNDDSYHQNEYKQFFDAGIEQVGPAHLINKINRKSDINFYIKSSLERILYKKILMTSIVKTWKNLYTKAYLKAMYKTMSSFLTNQTLAGKPKAVHNFNLFFHYYKINRMYASKTSLSYFKEIIKVVKSYFKRNILLTLQNIKEPIFSASLAAFSLGENNYKTRVNHSSSSSHSKNIPIPYSIAEFITKKSDELIVFLSLDTFLLVDLLAKKGFMSGLVVGKFFENSRPNSTVLLQNKASIVSARLPFIPMDKNDSIQKPAIESDLLLDSPEVLLNRQSSFKKGNKSNLDYKIQLSIMAKNLLSISNPSQTIDGLQDKKNDKLSEPFYGLKPQQLFDSFDTLDKNQRFAFISSKWKVGFAQLLPFRLLKQNYLDFWSINHGKYPTNKTQHYNYRYSANNLFPQIKKNESNGDKQIHEISRPWSNYSMQQFLDSPNNLRVSGEDSRKVSPSSKNTASKRLYNNVYTLSHRERWGSRVNEGKDWEIFLLYNSAAPFSKSEQSSYLSSSDYKDRPIFAYKERISSMAFNSQSNTTSSLEINPTSRFSQNKKPYGVLINNSFFSGPGIVQQLLNELTFTEMKKLDKQNRLLLYILNKSIFRLKKHIKIFIYDKSSQIEMKELCKRRDLLIRRTKLVRKLFRKDADPSSMILTVLPVLPPDLRPIVKMGGQIAASDLNRFYQRVIYRNDRLKKFLKDPATSHSYEMKYAQRLLQESVDNLIQNSQSNGEKDSRGRALKSLSDILKGKQGRFRQFLLGKRVDYSGRSVIVVGPKLKLYECGIPVEMALELYLPFLLKTILNKNYSKTVVGAKSLMKNNRPLALELLREIMQVSPVLLNRAPTLHRLGFQAFVPKLVEGRAIILHPLVCSSFNADFDGDQMAVHVPITIEARAEAWKIMLSRNNLLSPATGDPLAIPSQDMVLGCYYLTTNSNKSTLSLLRGSGLFFTDVQKVLYAYNLQKIDLHAIVWVKWSGFIENGNDQEEPVEIRLSSLGHWKELSYNYIRDFDSKSELIHQYMATTPGRILFHSLLKSI